MNEFSVCGPAVGIHKGPGRTYLSMISSGKVMSSDDKIVDKSISHPVVIGCQCHHFDFEAMSQHRHPIVPAP